MELKEILRLMAEKHGMESEVGLLIFEDGTGVITSNPMQPYHLTDNSEFDSFIFEFHNIEELIQHLQEK